MTSKIHKSVSDVIQTFREAQNLLTTLYAHLSALGNIMAQKAALAGAVRRRAQCFAAASSSLLLHDEDEDDEVTSWCARNAFPSNTQDESNATGPILKGQRTYADRRCTHSTTAVATAPMGVLAAFPASAAQHLIAQHQRDEEELLGVMSRVTQQSWPQKVAQLKAKVAAIEEDMGAATSTTSGDSRSFVAVSSCTPAQLSVALFGFVACGIKMGSVLQEVMLALRNDTRSSLLCAAESSAGAAGLAESLAAVMARESQLATAEASLLTMHEPGHKHQPDAPATLERRRGDRGDVVRGMPPEPLPLVEAVGMLEGFLKAQWQYCRTALLPEESHILLVTM